MNGTVRETGGGVYLVALDDGRDVEASLRGRLKLEPRMGDRVVIGDRVEIEASGDAFVITSVHPRRRQIARAGYLGRRPKVVAANVDTLVAVLAARDPDPHPSTLDRLLVIAEANDLEAVVVVNKVDLEGARDVALELAEPRRRAGYQALLVSAVSGEGLDDLRGVLCRGTSALVGPSGAGKSTLLNAIEPGLRLRTGALSSKVRQGRHTTVSARLIRLSCGGYVADTPGFGDVSLWDVSPEELARCFPELRELAVGCRFRGCAHLSEPDCAVRAAVERGDVAASRYESYRALREGPPTRG